MSRTLAALLLLAPAAALAGGRTAALRISAQVRRSVTVSVSVDARSGAPALVVETAGTAVWSGSLADAGAARSGAVRAEPSAEHPGYVVVTVLADVRR